MEQVFHQGISLETSVDLTTHYVSVKRTIMGLTRGLQGRYLVLKVVLVCLYVNVVAFLFIRLLQVTK